MLLGLKRGGTVLVNTESPIALCREDVKMFFVPATRIAIETIGRPIMNTALMGALARITGLIGIDAIEKVISKDFLRKRRKGTFWPFVRPSKKLEVVNDVSAAWRGLQGR